ncbi:MAG: RNA polymerase sigma factor [bacterium]
MADNENNIESELIDRCKKGDGDAFGHLIGQYRRQLFTYLLRFQGERGLAEDLFQETLLKAWKFLPSYHHRSKFTTWLFSIAHNVVVDAMRRQKTRDFVCFAEQLPDRPSESDPAAEVLAGETCEFFEKALQQLPENQRQVFLLRQHSGMSFQDIAVAMNQPLNTVLGHMHYAVSNSVLAMVNSMTLFLTSICRQSKRESNI